jgi:16S rRNA (guanine966-N2)-methyltransferase
MRIIAGKLKGKKINFLKSQITRPLRDYVKENIFNILEHSNLIDIDIRNKEILDLYSGIGSFGIECISRGAKNVTFVEKDTNALNILENNIKALKIEEKTSVFTNETSSFIEKSDERKFDIFFFDPPFDSKNYVKDLELIKHNKLYNQKNLVIIHRDSNTHEDLSFMLKTIFIKMYGRSKIIFGTFLN